MIDEKYNKTQASIWQWVKTVDQFSEPCFNKAASPHPTLHYLPDESSKPNRTSVTLSQL